MSIQEVKTETDRKSAPKVNAANKRTRQKPCKLPSVERGTNQCRSQEQNMKYCTRTRSDWRLIFVAGHILPDIFSKFSFSFSGFHPPLLRSVNFTRCNSDLPVRCTLFTRNSQPILDDQFTALSVLETMVSVFLRPWCSPLANLGDAVLSARLLRMQATLCFWLLRMQAMLCFRPLRCRRRCAFVSCECWWRCAFASCECRRRCAFATLANVGDAVLSQLLRMQATLCFRNSCEFRRRCAFALYTMECLL